MEYITWKVDGEFITNFVRDRLYKDRQPYSAVEQLLLSCLINDSISVEDTKTIICDILSCKKKLVGINSFTVEDDDGSYIGGVDLSTDNLLSTIFLLEDQAIQLNTQVMELEQELGETKELLQQYVDDAQRLNQLVGEPREEFSPITKLRKHLASSAMVDIVSWRNIFGTNPSEEIKQKFTEFCDIYNIFAGRMIHGDWEWIQFYDKGSEALLSCDDFKARGIAIEEEDEPELAKDVEDSISNELELEYRFVTPKGDFLAGPWGSHTELAYQIIDNNDWYQEYYNWSNRHDKSSTDFLVYVKHYVLLHNPAVYGRVQITRNTEYRLTKAQKDFLYEYLMKDGQDILANHIMREE